jgi:8-amino-7-oxononanoate synthase
LVGARDLIIADRLSHASLIDGCRLSAAKLLRFRHNDPDHLHKLLQKYHGQYRQILIITEAIFSMDGDLAPLAEIVTLKNQYQAWLLLDEAHATGVCGPKGQGLAAQTTLASQVEFLMGTFSKGLGSYGAYLAADTVFIEYLINTCRSFIFTTALPPSVIGANLAAIELVQKNDSARQKLHTNWQHFRQSLSQRHLPALGNSQIVPVPVGAAHRTLAMAAFLLEQGIYCLAVRYPTVPQNQARLRFSITANHTPDQLEKAATYLEQAFARF